MILVREDRFEAHVRLGEGEEELSTGKAPGRARLEFRSHS